MLILQEIKQKWFYSYLKNNKVLTYPDIQLLSPQKLQVAYWKEHTWFIITWSIMQYYANFIRDR